MSRALVATRGAAPLDLVRAYASLEKARLECDIRAVKKLKDAGQAIAAVRRSQRGAEREAFEAYEFVFAAARTMGAMLSENVRHAGGRPARNTNPGLGFPSLKELDITEMQSSRFQAVAAIPETELLGYVQSEREKKKPQAPTVKGALKHRKLVAREQKRQDAIASDTPDDPNGTVERCRIEKLELPPKSVDMIFTDPPYHDKHVKLYDQLGELAVHALKPGGFCLVYAGKMNLPQVIQALGQHLYYFWQFVVFHPFSKARVSSLALFENYRPVLVFRSAGGKEQGPTWVSDVVRGRREKEDHDWQQDEDAPRQYIDAYTEPGEVVLDPFCGGGTTAAVCKALGRRWLCFDADDGAVKITRRRLAKIKKAGKP